MLNGNQNAWEPGISCGAQLFSLLKPAKVNDVDILLNFPDPMKARSLGFIQEINRNQLFFLLALVCGQDGDEILVTGAVLRLVS